MGRQERVEGSRREARRPWPHVGEWDPRVIRTCELRSRICGSRDLDRLRVTHLKAPTRMPSAFMAENERALSDAVRFGTRRAR